MEAGDKVEQHLDEIAEQHTQQLLPEAGRAGSAAVEDELATAAQELDTLTYPDEGMNEEEFEEKMEQMTPQEVRRELQALEMEAEALEGSTHTPHRRAAPAKGGGQRQQEEQAQQQAERVGAEEPQTAGNDQRPPPAEEAEETVVGADGPGQQQLEAAPAEEAEAAVEAAVEGQEEPGVPAAPELQAEAAPEAGLQPGVVAGEAQQAPQAQPAEEAGAQLQPEAHGVAGGPTEAGPGASQQQGEHQQVQRTQAVAAAAAPEGQMVPEEVGPAAAAAAATAAGQKRKAEEPAEQQQRPPRESAVTASTAEPAGTGSAKGHKRAKKGSPAAKASGGGGGGGGGGGSSVYLEAVEQIPQGETRTYAEVAQAAGEGPGGGRIVGKALRSLDLQSSEVPWWRVVAANGSLHAAGEHIAQLQLQKLRNEGARPDAGDSVADWCLQAGCHVVGCYEYAAERMIYANVDDPRANDFNTHKVEKFADEEAATKRGFVRLAAAELEE